MEFIKKHYEKIILSVVLFGLVGTLVAMWFVIIADKQKMSDLTNTYLGGSAKPLAELDLSRLESALNRLKQPHLLDLSTTNKLFNPVQWQKDQNGRLIKLATGHEVGPGAAVVAKITPLYFSISLDSVMTNALGAARYKINVEYQGAALPAQRHPHSYYASVGIKENNIFTLVSVTGAPEDPSELTLKLSGGETVTAGKDRPYRAVEGYSADLKYEPEKINAPGLRVGDPLNFAGDQYNIIDITQNEVRLLAQSNQKKYVLTYRP
ncbi:MAG TPA: hypothetical protein VE344_06390 [Methylomirabilota bacterium]|nr:hypothetical protein [Methylomirabilota bacterium]